MMVYINDVFAQVCNIHMTDEAANLMIEEAALSAAAQVREECHRRRLAEKHNAVVAVENEERRLKEAGETAAWRAKEVEISRQRTEALRQAEAMPPTKPNPWKNSMW